ncbi:MAG: HRDC domain-containing protein, partial [Oscillospiraceae bacterium]|nr:HRDC domain-containing protein [Oscillospiraceae bacterium]
IEKSAENEALDPETAARLQQAEEERLKQMTFYCHSKTCLRGYILRYFGEKAKAQTCGSCSVCRGLPLQAEPRAFAPAPGVGYPKPSQKAALSAAQLSPSQSELYSRLKALRARLAREQGVPAFVICTDKTLLELAARAPSTSAALQSVSGVGERKAAAYGPAFLEEIRSVLRQRGEL